MNAKLFIDTRLFVGDDTFWWYRREDYKVSCQLNVFDWIRVVVIVYCGPRFRAARYIGNTRMLSVVVNSVHWFSV